MLAIGYGVSLVPYCTCLGVLAQFGPATITWNEQALTGIAAPVAWPFIGLPLSEGRAPVVLVARPATLSRRPPAQLSLALVGKTCFETNNYKISAAFNDSGGRRGEPVRAEVEIQTVGCAVGSFMTNPDRITVFYDGSCPMCRREIGFYRRCKGAQIVEWEDVSRSSRLEIAPGVSRAQAMARLHVRRGDGSIVSGGYAFATIWLALPGFRRLGVLARYKPLAWLLERTYGLFLKVRPLIKSLADSNPFRRLRL
jgi:predicted DCC family thiol-disulfide oxidoreductase YuxK